MYTTVDSVYPVPVKEGNVVKDFTKLVPGISYKSYGVIVNVYAVFSVNPETVIGVVLLYWLLNVTLGDDNILIYVTFNELRVIFTLLNEAVVVTLFNIGVRESGIAIIAIPLEPSPPGIPLEPDEYPPEPPPPLPGKFKEAPTPPSPTPTVPP